MCVTFVLATPGVLQIQVSAQSLFLYITVALYSGFLIAICY